MNQDGPSLIIQAPPPPPPPRGPHIAKDVNIFTYMYNLLSPAMVTIVFPCCTYVSSVMMSS